MAKNYLRKNVSFDPENELEMELYHWLQKLKYGEFAARTKQFWLEQKREEDVAKARKEE